MSSVQEAAAAENHYRVVSVTKAETPEGMEGDNWYCYIIKRGDAVLTGRKPGSLKLVTEHAEQVASDLNSRRGNYSGSHYAPLRKKK